MISAQDDVSALQNTHLGTRIACWRTVLKDFPSGGLAINACGPPSGTFNTVVSILNVNEFYEEHNHADMTDFLHRLPCIWNSLCCCKHVELMNCFSIIESCWYLFDVHCIRLRHTFSVTIFTNLHLCADQNAWFVDRTFEDHHMHAWPQLRVSFMHFYWNLV